ncbi:alpha/beta hydrolase [Pseudonocardiaceae bacterium YIM PH 21723]|nr:alpha/beta hydrolase [Pseudonocardiaceae bacterium YIM PH 21723]
MTERLVRTDDDMTLWTESLGSPEDPPVFLLNGATWSATHWSAEFLSALTDAGLRVIRYDHRDTGRSTWPTSPYGMSELLSDSLAVLDAWQVPSAHLVGLSMGGYMAQLLAVRWPQRVRSLSLAIATGMDHNHVRATEQVLRGEVPPLPGPKPEVLTLFTEITRAKPADDEAAELDRRVDLWAVFAGKGTEFEGEVYRNLEAAVIAHTGSLVPATGHARIPPELLGLDHGHSSAEIVQPTLVIQGQADPFNQPGHGRHMAGTIPRARLVEIEGYGHLPPAGRWVAPVAGPIIEHIALAESS